MIATIPKGPATQLQVRLREYLGRHLLDVRVFDQKNGRTDEWFPTVAGFSIPLAKLTLLRDAIIDAEQAARSRKLVRGG